MEERQTGQLGGPPGLPDEDLEPKADLPDASQHHTLKYHLLGPSLTKSGQDGVDQKKVSEIIYNASKGSKYFNNEEVKDKQLTVKINRILAKKRELERVEAAGGLKNEMKKADDYIAVLEYGRDLTQAIVHVDCDAFYAAVEELDRPELKEVPFAVGKGVLTTCNYLARKFGCRSGMAGFVADQLCPELIHIPLNFEKYTAKAKEVRSVLEQYDPRFESSSIDEAYLNITQYCKTHDMSPEDAVSQMRAQVFEETKITVSAGIAANAKLAKICSNKNKPNGQYRLASDRTTIMGFMRDLPTRKVNGVGRVLERELDAIGIKTCGDIGPQRHYINRLFGEKAFEFLMGVHLGLGRTEVRPAGETERKSVGTESTFHDMSDPKELRDKLRWISDELEKDLQRTEFKGRTLVLKVKLHTYEVLTRQFQPPKAVCTADDLYHFGLPMLVKLESEHPGMKLRLMGLRCTHLVSTKKADVDFFGRARGKVLADASNTAKVDNDGWEVWPDEEFEDAARQEREEDMAELEALSQEHHDRKTSGKPPEGVEDYGRYANGFAWRALLEQEEAQNKTESLPPEQWDCPICSVPQAADEKRFNEHIDGCLSRQTIKEIVKEPSPADKTSTPLTQSNNAKRKRGKIQATAKTPAEHEKKAKRAFFA
ncbi:DNA-directed polymerase kappa like protein [Zymoseptoria brevis]|uniref:DNA polymerase kappa n=1 Tax=Zymoseptoria brevis TaxID=1047168 RepID=A0A0F4GIE9_9PEZI|nr:DNA-directed polymerase kappa like protein [Zymoseptoria brevis]